MNLKNIKILQSLVKNKRLILKVIFITQVTNLIVLSLGLTYLKRGQIIQTISDFTNREIYWS
tara:strand:+ start:49 stop:234 length:186 start_codon:yes stop_codon:yes gene_type:complete